MNKADLIDAISTETETSKADAAKSLDATLNAIAKSLSEGDSVSLLGFGKFSVSRHNARTGRNPQTGAEIQIPARNVVKFSVAKALKDLVQTDSGGAEAAADDSGGAEAPAAEAPAPAPAPVAEAPAPAPAPAEDTGVSEAPAEDAGASEAAAEDTGGSEAASEDSGESKSWWQR